ncbi:uncharacterized protein J3R85_004251 [Psidium guajava]|nr:uncharacterized protein J3R85_004251 [Psidium guajava]
MRFVQKRKRAFIYKSRTLKIRIGDQTCGYCSLWVSTSPRIFFALSQKEDSHGGFRGPGEGESEGAHGPVQEGVQDRGGFLQERLVQGQEHPTLISSYTPTSICSLVSPCPKHVFLPFSFDFYHGF